jgi:steroid 5-alpha reductase family enzyme
MSELEVYISLAGYAWAAVAALMLMLWLISLKTKNAAIVDVGWTLGLFTCAVMYAIFGGGRPLRKAMFLVMVGGWALRLGGYLFFTRIWKQPEEGRYQQIRKNWKVNINLKFFFFFEFQGLLDAVLSLPFLFAAVNARANISMVEYLGFLLWAGAMAGEAVADAQLNAFKRNPANKGRTCRVGLWNYSRHPNYFFEWFIWVSWLIFALGSPHGWMAALCPALMLLFLFKVTGIPATEAQALRSRGEDYRQYQQTTSVFVPWFRSEPHIAAGAIGRSSQP